MMEEGVERAPQNAAQVAFIGALVYANPWLLPFLQVHLDDNQGLLPHFFLSEVEGHLEAEIKQAGTATEHVRAVMDCLEAAHSFGSADVEGLILVSFLELLPRSEEPVGRDLRSMCGSNMRRQLDILG